MISRVSKKVSVQYRKLDDVSHAFGKKTLQTAISECLKEPSGIGTIGDDPSARQQIEDGYGILVLNYIIDREDYFFGELVRFEPGASLPLLETKNGTKSYNLKQAQAPEGTEPLRGILHFMAIRNHVMVIESDVKTTRAEQYFQWILSNKTEVIKKNSKVILIGGLTLSDKSKSLREVDEIRLKPKPLSANEIYADAPELPLTSTSLKTKDVEKSNTRRVLLAAGFEDVSIDELMDDGRSIEISLQIKIKGTRTKRGGLSPDETNRLIRNIDEEDLELIGPDGAHSGGKIQRLSHKAYVATVGSLLDTKDVIRVLYEGYKRYLEDGYID